MTIKLSKSFAANGKVEEYDVRQMKKALNRLGYYQPYEKIGITDIPDRDVFEALKAFQKNHSLRPTGEASPGDETVQALDKESAKTPDGHYIWRTVEDEKVRSEHAQYNRTIRAWSDSPDPGEDYNCRCWAEPISIQEKYGPSDCRKEQEKYDAAKERFQRLDERLKSLQKEIDVLQKEKDKLLKEIKHHMAGTALGMWVMDFPIAWLEGNIPNIMRKFAGSKVQKSLMDQLQDLFDKFTKLNTELKYKEDQKSIVAFQLLKSQSDVVENMQRLNLCKNQSE